MFNIDFWALFSLKSHPGRWNSEVVYINRVGESEDTIPTKVSAKVQEDGSFEATYSVCGAVDSGGRAS